MDLKPDEARSFRKGSGKILLIACGALGREIITLIEVNDWHHLDVTCLPAKLHNEPKKIPEAVRAKIHDNRDKYQKIFVLYADCGTGGLLDKVLAGIFATFGDDNIAKMRPSQMSAAERKIDDAVLSLAPSSTSGAGSTGLGAGGGIPELSASDISDARIYCFINLLKTRFPANRSDTASSILRSAADICEGRILAILTQ